MTKVGTKQRTHEKGSLDEPTSGLPDEMPRWTDLGGGCPRVLRLGLATRGNTHLEAGEVVHAVARGVNYLNWCGYDDGLAQALRERRIDRERAVVAMQLESRDRAGAAREMEQARRLLGTERIDVVTFYYVESQEEWHRIVGAGGAIETLELARARGQVRLIGLTTHQRRLGAQWVESGRQGGPAGPAGLDLLMIRYNAAHRGAEQDVFPVTDRLGAPVVGFTAQRWGALEKRTADDPPGFTLPPAREWYRFALAHPAVNVVLMAPANRGELDADLTLLEDWRRPDRSELEILTAHGRRVRQRAGAFP